MYDLNELSDHLKVMDGKLDLLISMRIEERDEIKMLSRRTRSLERKWSFAVGVSAIISALGSWFAPSAIKRLFS